MIPVRPGELSGSLWPLHLKPRSDELLSSWMVRLAAAHGLPPREFASAVWTDSDPWRRDVDRYPPAEVLRILSEKTATTPERVAATSLSDFEGRLFGSLHARPVTPWLLNVSADVHAPVRGELQFCPRCLVEDDAPYFRRAWRLACSAVCTVHGVVLLERCWRCGLPPQIHRGRGAPSHQEVHPGAYCSGCAADLRDAAELVNVAPAEQVVCQGKIDEVLSAGWVLLPERRWVYGHLYFAVLRQVVRLLSTGKAARRLREETCASLGLSRPTVVEHPGRPQVEALGVEERRGLLPLAVALLDHWPRQLVRVCRAARVWSSDLLREMYSVPFWYEEVVRGQLNGADRNRR